MRFKKIKMVLGSLSLFIFLSTTLASAEILEKSDHWKSFLSIYGWVPAFTGDAKFKGLDFEVDTTYGDTLNNLKFFFMGHYEGFKGRWGIMVDGMYGRLEKVKDHSGGAIPGTKQFKLTQLRGNRYFPAYP